jgi:hypothetical protein
MASIGCFALFETVPCGKRYAAMVMLRDGHVANLAWHTENIYATGEAPDSAMFTSGKFVRYLNPLVHLNTFKVDKVNFVLELHLKLWCCK